MLTNVFPWIEYGRLFDEVSKKAINGCYGFYVKSQKAEIFPVGKRNIKNRK
jgi:hypothetical protein